MIINWKKWAPLGIVAIVAVVIIGFYQFRTKAPAAGNVDDAVNAIFAEVADDEAFFADVEKDAELLVTDSQAISDFGQSYNENEL